MKETFSSYGPLTLPSPPRRGRGMRALSPRCSVPSDPSPAAGEREEDILATLLSSF